MHTVEKLNWTKAEAEMSAHGGLLTKERSRKPGSSFKQFSHGSQEEEKEEVEEEGNNSCYACDLDKILATVLHG